MFKKASADAGKTDLVGLGNWINVAREVEVVRGLRSEPCNPSALQI